MRLQKYIAHSGVTSRRKAEEMILQSRVKVNGFIVKKLGTKVDPEKDLIEVDNKRIELASKKLYIMLNKPEGYVTTLKDEHNKKVVLDLIDNIKERIFPIGRLDKDTTGLLIMTNDGDLTYKLTHPSHEVWKKYLALVDGIPNHKEIQKLKKGVKIDGRLTSKAKVKMIKIYNDSSVLEISIHEGRNRQVRKMCKCIGHPIRKLKRISIGELKLNDLEIGEWRHLTEKEIKYLKTL
ncbi:rRNA pseudouridine synthase [Schnuerera sp. xch1]|uniref:pseudouridine synthase n=1 Tax=Schnuerera sp. xch1 TaxID=2874283 RepID=UPI001CBE4DE9|nr:pseudouridine synthase [Schnuerera sp. xch1]MBZ2173780.1 rRNA pseudouridine synthase [Schnuerera sp. xch1]